MPSIAINLPQTDRRTRAALAEALTKAFSSATGFEPEILDVFFHEYSAGQAAHGGALVEDLGRGGPVHVLICCPRIARGKKQAVAQNLTSALRAATGWDVDPVVHISEHPYDNVVVNGKLLSDAFEECRRIPFYYPMTDPKRVGSAR
jgi:phenylpyruvate tautomerase PptA (4-oxalocrotonate tautomerase family)